MKYDFAYADTPVLGMPRPKFIELGPPPAQTLPSIPMLVLPEKTEVDGSFFGDDELLNDERAYPPAMSTLVVDVPAPTVGDCGAIAALERMRRSLKIGPAVQSEPSKPRSDTSDVRVTVATLLEETAQDVRDGLDAGRILRRIDQLTDLVDTLQRLAELQTKAAR